MSFEASLKHVLKSEAGFVCDPVDLGGATNFGVTIMTLARYRGLRVTPEDVKNLSLEEATQVYRKLYWEPSGLGKLLMRERMQLVLFDQIVNRGHEKPIAQAQLVLNKQFGFSIPQDGAMGPKTINALNSVDEIKFCLKYLQLSILAYDQIVEANGSQVRFLKGWHNRVFLLQDAVLGYA